jgi:protein-S-isoprenylcysteine O-methyltransferase Ste14
MAALLEEVEVSRMLSGIYQSIAILATVIVFYVADVWFIKRYDPLRTKGSSRNWIYTIVVVAAFIFIVAQPMVWPGLGIHVSAWWGLLAQALGLALVIAGMALHWWTRMHLGQFFSERVEFQEGQYLVETGPYAYVRHPLYTAFFTLVTGLLLLIPALTTLLLTIYAFVDFTLVTRREEKLLAEKLPGYSDYMARTPRFLPRFKKDRDV